MAREKGDLRLDVNRVGETVVVRIHGSADTLGAASLNRRLEDVLTEKAAVVVLDLSGLDFICSMGLAAIIGLHLKSRHHRGQVRLVSPQPKVRALLETTRLTKLFPVYSSLASATAT